MTCGSMRPSPSTEIRSVPLHPLDQTWRSAKPRGTYSNPPSGERQLRCGHYPGRRPRRRAEPWSQIEWKPGLFGLFASGGSKGVDPRILSASKQNFAAQSISDQYWRRIALVPPYPITTRIPNAMLGQAIIRHIVFQGLLTASGRLENMQTTGAATPTMMEVLALLKEWQFRPALKNKEPIEVEVLLVIPSRS